MSEVYFIFNGKSSKDFGIEVRQIGRDILPQFVSNDTENVPGRPGNYSWGTNVGQYKIPVWIQWNRRGKFEDFRQLTRQIAAWLDTEGKPAPLVFSDEPDKTYYAYLTGGTSIDQLLHMGQATITFNCPYPYAYGKRVTRDGLEAIYTSFRRNTPAYDSRYNEIAPGLPRYEVGKYGQGIFIEEGTTNLLSSASSPTQEEVPVSVGEDLYLSTVGGSTKIEHVHREEIGLTLDKEGTDFTRTDRTPQFMEGTHNQTAARNGGLTLAYETPPGEDVNRIWNSKETWEDSANIREGLGYWDDIGDGLFTFADPPQWNFGDDFSDYETNWRIQSPEAGGEVIQNEDYVTIRGTASGANFGIDTQNNTDPRVQVSFPCTLYVLYRGRNSDGARLIVEDGTTYGFTIRFQGDNDNKWNHYWIRCGTEEALVYKNGVLVNTFPVRTGGGVANQLQFDIQNGTSGDFDIGAIYADWDYDKGPPPSDGWWKGTWESPYIDISAVAVVQEASIGWEFYDGVMNWEDYEDGTVDFSKVKLEYQLRVDGIEQGWVTIFDDPNDSGGKSALIPDLPQGTDVSSTEIKLRITLETADPAGVPHFYYLSLNVVSAGESFYLNGSYTSPVYDISGVGRATSTLIDGVFDLPDGTDGAVEISVNGGEMVPVQFGQPIPGIDQYTDLETIQYRVTLQTTDSSVTPALEEITIQLLSGYIPEKSFALDPVDVSNIGTAVDSYLEWISNTPASTSVSFEVSLDGSTWEPVSNGNPFIDVPVDMAGTSVHIRGKLTTSDNAVAPSVDRIEWRIAQQEPNRINPATETLLLTPANVTRWQLEPKTYATTWTVGTRDPETLTVSRLSRIMNPQEGTFLIWVYDDLKNLGRRQYVFDTDEHLFSLFRDGSNFHLQIDGQDFAAAPAVSGWVHFGVRWSGQTFAFFVNGTKVKEDNIGSPIDWETDSDLLWIGSDSNGENQWNQILDDIHVSARAMSDGEILDAYNSPAPLPMGGDTTYKMDFEGSFSDPTEGQLDVGGTAETFPVIQVKFTDSTPTFKITHVGKGQVMFVRHDFKPGDELVIDAEKSKIIINGAVQMTALDLSSDFFSLTPGRNELDFDPDGVAEVSATWTERWK